MEIKYNSLIPELTVTDINKSKEFYMKLGFKVVYERPETEFVFLQLEQNQIMIEGPNDNWNTGDLEYPFGRGINLSMEVSDIETLYNQVKQQIPIFQELKITPYRVDDEISEDKEFLIQDPDGYLLRFTSNE